MEQFKCKKCFDTGWIVVNGQARRCDCVRNISRELMRTMRIPPILYDQLEKDTVENTTTTTYANILSKSRKSLFIVGPNGVGKTYMAAKIMLLVYKFMGISSVFYDTRSLLSELKFYMNDPVVYNAFLREIKHVPLLVLDDVGAESLTEYNLEILASILYFRYNYNLPNIITSNIGFIPTTMNITNRVNSSVIKNVKQTPQQQQLKKIRNQYISFHELDNEIKADLEGRLGPVLTSRIADQYVFFVYEGKDRRMLKSNIQTTV